MTARENAAPARFFAMIRSADPAAVPAVARRFDLEFGVESEKVSERQGSWLALATPRAADRLADLRAHADRVGALYAEAALRIEVGYVDRLKVVVAERVDSRFGVYLGGGVWGRVALSRASEAEAFAPAEPPRGDEAWRAPEAIRFFEALGKPAIARAEGRP